LSARTDEPVEPATDAEKPLRQTEVVTVGTLASGQVSDVVVHRLIGTGTGPHLGLVGGTHGDEPFSVELVRQLLDRLAELPLRGTVTAVPCANPLALQSLTRNTPIDMLDLNRVFPGDPDGSFSQQLARVLFDVFAGTCQYLLDFHSGGIFPTVDYVFAQQDADLARSLGSNVLYQGTPHLGSVSDSLQRTGVHTTVVEVGGGYADGAWYVERAFAGVRNALCHIGMLPGAAERRDGQLEVHALSILRPHHGGLLVSNIRVSSLGEIVPGGHELGRVYHSQTMRELEVITAPFEQSVLILAREQTSPIGIGDFAYIVGDAAS
jgi:predicted deacylase